MNARVLLPTAALLFTAALPALAAQQCPFGDDGLANVACCAPAQTNLPQFPGFQIEGDYCCIRNCQLESGFDVDVQTVHVQVLCDYAIVPIVVAPASAGAPGWTGVLLAKYARTWTEPLGAGASRQVWRFLVNGDLTATAGQRPCPIPPHPDGADTHFHGHLDYACEPDPNGGTAFRMALSLHHLPGCIEHNVLGCRPLADQGAHADRSYHLIAPGAFDCTPVNVPQGPIQAESFRSTRVIPSYQCLGEARVTQGVLTNENSNWLCNPADGGPFAWVHQRLDGVVQCGGAARNFRSIPLCAPLPPLPTGLVALPIGKWTLPPERFPGDRELVINWGFVGLQDRCNPNDLPIHVVQGVTTSGAPGRLFTGPDGLIFNVFTDLQDMIDTGSFGSQTTRPTWGCLFFSKRVWNLNLD